MSNASPTVPMAEPPSYETQQARHPGQQPPQNQQQQQQQLQQQYHHPASTTSAMNGFYHAIQQRHGQADAMIKDGEMAQQNQPNASLFSPWFNFGTSGAAFLPMPSPSLGDSINDTFVPWSENIFSSGLTPTPGQPMSQNYPILDMHTHMQGGGEDRTFIKQEAPFMPFAMPNIGGGDNKRQGPAADLRKESLASGPGSVARVDSSSSGASAASMLMDGNVRTPTPLFKSREPPRSFDSAGSYFTYPRPGGPEQMPSSYQHQPQLYSHQSDTSQQAVQPSQLFHQSQPSFQGHMPNQFMSFPPGLMQQNISQHQSYMHQPDRQNSRESTSSEASSISPAMLNSRAPRTGSPVSMYSDDVLHSISAQTSPRSQVSLHLPGPNYNNTASGSAGQYTSGPGSLLKNHRDSTSSMQTDMSADGVDGVDVNADDDPDSMRKEKNGMIWGMDAPTYYKMSAVERKKLRNKLSARTHRVKRKQKAQDTEQQLEVARDEIDQLRAENAALQARLAKYEGGQC